VIAVDTSALMAILLGESSAEECATKLSTGSRRLISAGTLTELHIAAKSRGLESELRELLDRVKFEVVPVTAEVAMRIGQIYARWGKGIHPASLNFGDCFAYDVAKEYSCPLLFIGNDFSQTDIARVINAPSHEGP
jgi:ribonuclease VapC